VALLEYAKGALRGFAKSGGGRRGRGANARCDGTNTKSGRPGCRFSWPTCCRTCGRSRRAGVTGLANIAQALNDRSVRVRGRAWHNSTVRNLLPEPDARCEFHWHVTKVRQPTEHAAAQESAIPNRGKNISIDPGSGR
jgi:hypothetical protein